MMDVIDKENRAKKDLVSVLQPYASNNEKVDALIQKLNHLGPCPNLKESLTLADYKTTLLCGERASQIIVSTLNLEWNLDTINQAFPLAERIRSVSDEVLNRVKLGLVQRIGEKTPLLHSAAWYALAPDELFLSRQVQDLEHRPFLETDVPAARVREINCEVFTPPFIPPWFFQKLELTIAELRELTGAELNQIAGRIPANACALFSDEQVKEVDFHKFKGEQLDKMMEGDVKGLARRINSIAPHQITPFLKKSRGLLFYAFDISKIPTLNFSLMNYEQASSLLTRSDLDISIEESRRRIQKVPIKALPDLQKLSQKSVFLTNGFFIYLSDAQLQALDCSLLTPKQIHNLFPGFTLDTFHPGYTHTQEVRKGKIYHFFESEKEGAAYGYFQDELDQLCTERKEQCRVFASRFTPKQKEILKSRVHPEVRELLA